MKAAVIERHGGAEQLQYRDWPDPELPAGHVMIRVASCGLNYLDVFVREGMPGLPVPLPFISGSDIAGTVETVGDGISTVRPGDRVLVDPATPEGMLGEQIPGGMAELVSAPATHLVPIPDNVTFDQAACLPVAYGTARRMLLDRAILQAGETVLILGASGGVGTGAVQMARNIGATVIACAGSDEKCERLREIGADHTINYSDVDFSREAWKLTGKRGVDVAVNFTGGDTWVPSIKTLRKGGRLVTCGATAGYDPRTDLRYVWVRELTIVGSDGWTTDDIRVLLDDVSNQRIAPIIDTVLPLSEAREAERLIQDREVFGKVLLHP